MIKKGGLMAMGLLFLIAGMVFAADDRGPEAMNLKERFNVSGHKAAVIFQHRKHQEKLDCAKCHVDPKGGGDLVFVLEKKDGFSNDFHKKFCWPCHTEMEVPIGKSCVACHVKQDNE